MIGCSSRAVWDQRSRRTYAVHHEDRINLCSHRLVGQHQCKPGSKAANIGIKRHPSCSRAAKDTGRQRQVHHQVKQEALQFNMQAWQRQSPQRMGHSLTQRTHRLYQRCPLSPEQACQITCILGSWCQNSLRRLGCYTYRSDSANPLHGHLSGLAPLLSLGV